MLSSPGRNSEEEGIFELDVSKGPTLIEKETQVIVIPFRIDAPGKGINFDLSFKNPLPTATKFELTSARPHNLVIYSHAEGYRTKESSVTEEWEKDETKEVTLEFMVPVSKRKGQMKIQLYVESCNEVGEQEEAAGEKFAFY